MEIVWRNHSRLVGPRVVVDRTVRRNPETGDIETIYRRRATPEEASVEYEIVVKSGQPVSAAQLIGNDQTDLQKEKIWLTTAH